MLLLLLLFSYLLCFIFYFRSFFYFIFVGPKIQKQAQGPLGSFLFSCLPSPRAQAHRTWPNKPITRACTHAQHQANHDLHPAGPPAPTFSSHVPTSCACNAPKPPTQASWSLFSRDLQRTNTCVAFAPACPGPTTLGTPQHTPTTCQHPPTSRLHQLVQPPPRQGYPSMPRPRRASTRLPRVCTSSSNTHHARDTLARHA